MTSPSKHVRFCRLCKSAFLPKREWQHFCSDKCRIRYFAAEKKAADKRKDELIDTLEKENQHLLKENQQLKAEIERLK